MQGNLTLKLGFKKKNSQDTDTGRETYLETAMLGVGVNNIKKVIYIALTNFAYVNNDCLQDFCINYFGGLANFR